MDNTHVVLDCRSKNFYKSGDFHSKLVMHAIETNHVGDIDNSKIIKSNCNKYPSRTFLHEWYINT